MKRLLTLSILIVIGSFSFAQEQLSKRQQADLLFARYEYLNASKLYESLADRKKPDVKVLERLATCYRKMNNYQSAEKWYAKAVENPKVASSTYFYYAEVLLTNQKFDQAKTQYKNAHLPAVLLDVKLASCDSAAVWINQPSRFTVSNVQSLNTKYADWGLSYFGKNGLVFTSERPNGDERKFNDTYRWTGNQWLKLYQATNNGVVTNELPIVRKQYSSFFADYHVGPMVLNKTEDTAYVTIDTRARAASLPVEVKENKYSERIYTRRLELVIVVKTDGRWSYLKTFPFNDVQAFSVGNAALSNDGKVLYFTSDMPGGMGKTDIWYSEKHGNGNWGVPVNCGPEINTPEEESFPTIGAANELYFASKGRIGMGGFDIYVSKGERASWGKSINLKHPVNTSYDDFYFSTADGFSGYLSSNRNGGLGNDDIYSFNYKAPEMPKPVVAVVTPKPPVTYEVGKTYVLRNVYYDFDKAAIRPDAAVELDKLVAVLNDYPNMHIELGSHTDSRGNDAYNLKLSQARAESAVAYLIGKGIDKDRLSAKGYGETMLVNRCSNGVKCSEADHQANRRTEFKVKR